MGLTLTLTLTRHASLWEKERMVHNDQCPFCLDNFQDGDRVWRTPPTTTLALALSLDRTPTPTPAPNRNRNPNPNPNPNRNRNPNPYLQRRVL